MAQPHRPTGTGSRTHSPGAPAAQRDRLLRLGTPSVAAAALTATVALCMALVAFGNITDFGTDQQFVRHVLSMDTTFEDPDLMWRAVESPTLQNAAYVAVIIWETLSAAVLLAATWLWITGLRRNAYDRARAASTVGLVMVLLLFGAGFLHHPVRHVLKSLWTGSVGASAEGDEANRSHAADAWERDLSWLAEPDLADFRWGRTDSRVYVEITCRAQTIEVALSFWVKPVDAGWVIAGPGTLW